MWRSLSLQRSRRDPGGPERLVKGADHFFPISGLANPIDLARPQFILGNQNPMRARPVGSGRLIRRQYFIRLPPGTRLLSGLSLGLNRFEDRPQTTLCFGIQRIDDRLRVLEGVFGACIGCNRLHILANHDDR